MSDRLFFHLAIPINDTEKAKTFYAEALGSVVGRENKSAVILNFYGHQLVAHVTQEPLTPQKGIYPRHFGITFLDEEDWQTTLERAEKHKLIFRDRPRLRFEGKLTEHRTFFLEDPFFNLLEFKWYRHQEAIFGGQEVAEVGDR
ncbi:Glyoxalase/bleomycin resistance protein/dioxygenase [[Leptolyngbya] sp. PCC 7376]|uniref:VOC family protein n=1 Tax=[Leptolyngbya] sp. PCC 7376 TaxID=111781 RepID=UPI00029F3309|nr:VOC family protein [[Leptolyngbya] sp. PCC 7376]AFY39064.1 Glyoxalase/bleomycin resistance protein/dioxygenase [[Leptolyngbya] sp. PCC 7376]